MADSASLGVNCSVNNYAALLQEKAELLMFGDCKAWASSQGSILGVYSSTAGRAFVFHMANPGTISGTRMVP